MNDDGQDDLFGDVRGMVRKGDHFTCYLAAKAISKTASKLHEQITEEVYTRGPMTDQELEDIPRFSHYAYSSVRKRRTELVQGLKLVRVGHRKNNRGQLMQVWDLAGRAQHL